MPPEPTARAQKQHGRYVIGDEIAAGGMATVHLGRMLGDAGFARTVAIKRLHARFADDPDICAMLLDEGRLAARIQHLNVVTTLDVVASGGELFVVMEYVHGEALSALIRAAIRRSERIPPRIVAAVVSGALRGLHAVHEARDAQGQPLGAVHRDISPQNILVAGDGIARVLDFGIAKAAGRMHVTMDGRIKGKFGYMAPEQLHGEVLDRRADIYAAGVVLWEALVGARLFAGNAQAPDFAQLTEPRVVVPPSTRVRGLLPAHDAVVMRALAREPGGRFASALEMAEALEACGPVAPSAEVGRWVTAIAGEQLAERAARIAAVETRLVTGIRESRHLIEASDRPITRLDSVAATPVSAPPSSAELGVRAATAAPVPSEPPPAAPPASPAATAAKRGPAVWIDPSPVRGSAALWTGAAALGAVAIAVTFAVIASVPAAAVPATTPAAEPPASAPADPAAMEAGSAAPLAETAALPPSTTVLASATATSTPRARVAPPPVRAGGSALKPPAQRSAAGDACSPPFTIDAEGHKHYKRECLR